MKKTNYFLLMILLSFIGCGPSPDDYKTESIKSVCDGVKMSTEILKITNDLLEAEPDATKRKEIQNSDDFKKWTKKKLEILSFCSNNFEYNILNMSKCNEYDELSKELKRNRELYQSEFEE
jgi:hypothetical protein